MKLHQRRVALLILLCAGLSFPTSATALSTSTKPTIPEIVRRASSTYASELRGIVGMQRHFRTLIHGGPIRHSEESDSGILLQDGAFADSAYYRIADDGHPFSQPRVNERTVETNKDWAAGKVFFKEPYDPRFIDQYQFQALGRCARCPRGSVAVHFASPIRDTQHGAGTMWIDIHTAHVLALSYVPNALPPHATSGTVTEIGGQALPHLWYVVRIDENYKGKAVIFSGTGTFLGIFDHFQRFSNMQTAKAALQHGSV